MPVCGEAGMRIAMIFQAAARITKNKVNLFKLFATVRFLACAGVNWNHDAGDRTKWLRSRTRIVSICAKWK